MRSHFKLPAKSFAALLVLLSVAFFSSVVSAQTGHAPAKTNGAPSGNRFLFIVDTSSPMKSSSDEVLRVVDEVIRSSASGQMHPGDTLGVWTFNRQLYPGVMPLQTWTAEDKDEIALRTLEFLKQQHYGKESKLDEALDGMFAVIKGSDIITVFIISNGQSPIHGTPFDQQINALYAESIKEMKKSRKPIVTVLQAKHGKIIRYTVNALPWPVVIPEVPIRIKPAELAANNTAPAPAAAPEKVAPAPEPAPPVVVQKAAPVVTPSAPAPAPVVASPAPPPVVKPQVVPPPAVFPVTIPALEPPPVVAQNPVPAVAHVTATPVKPTVQPFPRSVPQSPPNKTLAARTESPPNKGEGMHPPAAKPPRHTNPLPAASPAASVEMMTATLNRSKSLLIGAIAGAAFSVALLLLLIYRSLHPPGPSLISRTMGNPPKE